MTTPSPSPLPRAELYNRDCRCSTLDWGAIRTELSLQPDGAELYGMLAEERSTLFAESPIFVPDTAVRRQDEIIGAVERVVALPAYRQRVLAHAPSSARYLPRARGVFLGYDFHLGPEGSRLIEINTNAGGSLLNALLLRGQNSSCLRAAAGSYGPLISAPEGLEQEFLAMFLEEWRLERGETPLRVVAIVDEDPAGQFLYPEFLLFRNLFQARGIEAVICGPAELNFADGDLRHSERRVDLVYNRLTDFGLNQPPHRALLDAYLAGAAVVTPHPHAHALYADKRNLALLTDPEALREMGIDAETRELLLGGIAHTVQVRPEDAETLWAARKRLFFKPAAGYGSKAAYRGDKITRRVFEEVLAGDYVAQALIPPSARRLAVGPEPAEFKLDLRHFVYRGHTQMLVSRLYQGQTTNFRTPGGGFAPVMVVRQE
jgi:glutathione synthase/RimK-type ligase-like ATP-grasp enzyme